MSFKQALANILQKQKARKQLKQQVADRMLIDKQLAEAQMSSNERELRRFQDEDREEQITEALVVARKERQHDINLNHNPLDVPNITKETDFQVLKQRNIFTGEQNILHAANVIKSPNIFMR